MNELIFLTYLITIAISAYTALRLGAHALVALMSLLAVLANLFVSKQIILFGFQATASDALAVGVTICLNLIQEYYGKITARKAITTSFICLLAYTAFSKLHLLYTPALADGMQIHFEPILAIMPRITIASLFTFFIVQHLDATLYGFIKKSLPKTSFTFRNFISTSITQFIDTVLFSFLGLYGIVNTISSIIMISYSIKLITIFILVPLVKMGLQIFPVNSE